MSQGDVVFEAGQGGSVMFTTAGGQEMDLGLKGEKVHTCSGLHSVKQMFISCTIFIFL